MNIENKIDQLTMKKQKILEMIDGTVAEMSNKFEYFSLRFAKITDVKKGK